MVWLASPALGQTTDPKWPRETDVVAGLAAQYKGVPEARLWDGSRVDLLSEDTAWEADWASKWTEAVGQSLYYSLVTRRKPGIILLIRAPDEEAHFVYRCQAVCARHDITLSIEHVKPLR